MTLPFRAAASKLRGESGFWLWTMFVGFLFGISAMMLFNYYVHCFPIIP